MSTKLFPLCDVLSIVTGRLCGKMEGIYTILNHMTNDDLFTHQLPRVSRECCPWLLRWFPELKPCLATAKMDEWIARAPTCPEEGVRMWITEQKMMFPDIKDEYDVPRIPADDHERINFYDELVQMRGTDEGIVLIGRDTPHQPEDKA
jgi:hypothetical protein